MRHWLDATDDEIASLFKDHNQPKFRASQFRDWLHHKRVPEWDAMTNLPSTLRQTLAGLGRLRTLHELERVSTDDGLTTKWLFAPDRDYKEEELFESVLIIEKERTRHTVCVSSMIGCPLGCTFCATGKLGFTRNLSSGEILEQIYRLDSWSGAGVSHVVFMGMGEPLLNLDHVLRAADMLADPKGMNLSGRHITISTAGVTEGIDALTAKKRNYRLAVSLHAPNQQLRETIMPSAKRWRLPELFTALEKFAATTSRAITFEYCLLKDTNDKPSHAAELSALVKRVDGKVNLIPYNGSNGSNGSNGGTPGADFAPPPAKTIRAFQEALESRGVSAPVRMEKGAEIGAACGQLRARRAKS